MYATHIGHSSAFASPTTGFPPPSPSTSTPPSAQTSNFSTFSKASLPHSSSNSSLDTTGSAPHSDLTSSFSTFSRPAFPSTASFPTTSRTPSGTSVYPSYPTGRPSPGVGGVAPALESLGFTAAYNHHSSIIKLHSYTPSFFSTNPEVNLAHFSPSPEGELEVNCTLLLSPTSMLASASSSSSASNASAYDPSRPKIIRVCFSSLPVATYVSRAPKESIVHPPSAPEDQDLVLTCTIPKWDELVAHGGASDSYVDPAGTGRIGLFCEILASPSGGMSTGDEQVLERIWFGDFAFMMGDAQTVDANAVEGLAIGGWTENDTGYLAPPQPPYYSDMTSSASPPTLQNRHSWSHPLPTAPAVPVTKYTYNGIAAAQEKSFQVSINTSELRPPTYASPADIAPPQSAPPFRQSHPPPARSFVTPPPPPPPPVQAAVPPQPSTNHSPFTSPPSHPPPPTTFYRHAMVAAATKVPPSPMKTPRAKAASSQLPKPSNTPAVPTGKKASLLLHGDLLQMTSGWNEEEWNSRRRLVQFWRKLEGSTIHATWAPISQAQYVENTVVVSCIFRDETNECYVTSVDAIYLLEALVGGRFSVEEKNRIRRNLERCKPDTMSKTKEETREFFSLIMGFPKPKPRNIEKDVKIFRWSDLPGALAKSISKYSITEGPPDGSLSGATTFARAVDDGTDY